jgi:hypothetical protein
VPPVNGVPVSLEDGEFVKITRLALAITESLPGQALKVFTAKCVSMQRLDLVWNDAQSIAKDALLEAGDPLWGTRLEMSTERIAGILSQSR